MIIWINISIGAIVITSNDYKIIYPKLMGYAVLKCRDRTLAEDLVSETIITAVNKLDQRLSQNDLIAWCITVLRNKYKDFLKKHRESQLNQDNPEDQKFEDPSSQQSGFVNILYSQCLNKLNADLSEVLLLNVLNGIKTSVISEMLGKPQNTILSWLTKAKTQFVSCIEAN